MWFLLGIFHCNTLLLKMKKVDSFLCPRCENREEEDICHILLNCAAYKEIRANFLDKLTLENTNLVEFCKNQDILVISILYPDSSLLPEAVMIGWKSLDKAYSLFSSFCYNIWKKREKNIADKDKPRKGTTSTSAN